MEATLLGSEVHVLFSNSRSAATGPDIHPGWCHTVISCLSIQIWWTDDEPRMHVVLYRPCPVTASIKAFLGPRAFVCTKSATTLG